MSKKQCWIYTTNIFPGGSFQGLKIYLKILNLITAIREAQLIGYEEKFSQVYENPLEYSQKFASYINI